MCLDRFEGNGMWFIGSCGFFSCCMRRGMVDLQLVLCQSLPIVSLPFLLQSFLNVSLCDAMESQIPQHPFTT